jgi:hypothetical protein
MSGNQFSRYSQRLTPGIFTQLKRKGSGLVVYLSGRTLAGMNQSLDSIPSTGRRKKEGTGELC